MPSAWNFLTASGSLALKATWAPVAFSPLCRSRQSAGSPLGLKPRTLPPPPRRMPQPRAHQILMRGHAQHVGKQPQEMERADAGLPGGIVKRNGAMRIGVDPQCALHCTATVAQACGELPGLASRHRLDEAD